LVIRQFADRTDEREQTDAIGHRRSGGNGEGCATRDTDDGEAVRP
jgi:hypothetical protein